jgi:hypothetical protein
MARNGETNEPSLPTSGLKVRRGSRFHLCVQPFGAQTAESGRSVFTSIDSLQSPSLAVLQAMGVLLPIGGKWAYLRANIVWVSRHLPMYFHHSMLVPQMGSAFPRKRCPNVQVSGQNLWKFRGIYHQASLSTIHLLSSFPGSEQSSMISNRLVFL